MRISALRFLRRPIPSSPMIGSANAAYIGAAPLPDGAAMAVTVWEAVVVIVRSTVPLTRPLVVVRFVLLNEPPASAGKPLQAKAKSLDTEVTLNSNVAV